ncbi:MAG: N-acetyl-gamma-glutamyl-phosphate reductase [Candidatus Puniceispirillaceae bacterium]
MTYRIFIDGGAGTTGLQVHDRLVAHPLVEPVLLDDARRKDAGARRGMMDECDLTILCLPDDSARESASMAAEIGARVIDASSAHRTADGWAYGFAELAIDVRAAIAGARQISNPGCYPTGFLALARPLSDAGLLPADAALAVPAVSGYSGGGKGMIARHEDGDLPPIGAYGLGLCHKHLPEMTRYAGLTTAPIFMPSVGSFYAGMLVHLPLHATQLSKTVAPADLYDVLAAHYATTQFVRMGAARAGEPETAALMLDASALAGSDHLELFVFANADASQFWLTARLDNLGKGASGAAVQNMNIALGFDEATGLTV